MWKDILLVFIGGLVSILTLIIERCVNGFGRIKIYSMFTADIHNQQKAFVISNGDKKTLIIPLKIQIVNNKNRNYIFRDLNISAFNENKYICDFVPCDCSIINNEEKEFHGVNGNYSFIVEPHTVKTLEGYFTLTQDEKNTLYNNLKLSFYKNNKKFYFNLINNIESWKTLTNIPREWIENKKYKEIK